jgi:hypothetical protein
MSRERNLRFATIALVGGSLLFGYALVRALVVSDPVDVANPPSAAPAVHKAAPSVEQPINSPAPAKKVVNLTSNALQLAVETDPFQPDRVRAPERYRFPGEEVIIPEVAPPPPEPPRPQFRVIGTITGEPGTGVAVIETPTGSRVLGVGETLNGFTLASVAGRTATVEGNGGRRYSLNVEDATPTRPGRAGRAGRAGGAPVPPGGRGGNAEGQAQLREAIERMRQMGVGGEAMQQMLRMLETSGGRGGGAEFQLRGDMIEVTRPGNTAVPAERIIIRPRVDTMTQAAAARRRN